MSHHASQEGILADGADIQSRAARLCQVHHEFLSSESDWQSVQQRNEMQGGQLAASVRGLGRDEARLLPSESMVGKTMQDVRFAMRDPDLISYSTCISATEKELELGVLESKLWLGQLFLVMAGTGLGHLAPSSSEDPDSGVRHFELHEHRVVVTIPKV